MAITDEQAIFFALGDGIILVNVEAFILESEPGNQPIYCSYALTGSTLTDHNPKLLDFKVVCQIPTQKLDHFLIGTDGVLDFSWNSSHQLPRLDETIGPLTQFWEDDKYFHNPAANVRKLVTSLLLMESHIIGAMGIDDGSTDFKQVFNEMGIPDEWILTPANNPSEIRRAFGTVSRSAVRASQAAGNFSAIAHPSRASPNVTY